MTRALGLVFAIFAYAIFFATFLYLIGFTGDLPWLAATVDRGAVAPPSLAAFVDSALIALFGIQHSVMARRSFKQAWTRLVPAPIERSTYVLFASIALMVLFAFWRPIPTIVWNVSGVSALVLWALFALGWLIVLTSTFLINHFELFGLQQVWFNLRGRAAAPPQFRQPLYYKLVRHPLYSGFFIAFWATPVMTVGHLLLATGMSIYMLVAIVYEERDLVALFGDRYEQYRRQVGMLAPGLGRRR